MFPDSWFLGVQTWQIEVSSPNSWRAQYAAFSIVPCGHPVTVFAIDRCPPGRLWGSVDPFPSIAGFQGIPRAHLPQHLQRGVGPAQINSDHEGTRLHEPELIQNGRRKLQTVCVVISTIPTITQNSDLLANPHLFSQKWCPLCLCCRKAELRISQNAL